MKKSIVYLLSMMAIFSLASCEKPEETQKPDGPQDTEQTVDFTLAVTVKTTDISAKAFAVGDEISVIHVENGGTSYVADGKFVKGGSGFTGKLPAKLDEAKKYNWFAFYPYSDKVTVPSKAPLKVAVAQTQAGYGTMTHIDGLLAYSGVVKAVEAAKAPAVELNPLMAVVKVDVENTDEDAIVVNKLTLGTESVDIAGEFNVNFAGDAIRYTAVNASKTVELAVTEGTAIAKDQKAAFYFAVKPSSLSGGEKITVTVESDKGNFFQAFELTEAKELSAGTITSFEIERAPVLVPELNVMIENIIGIDDAYDYEIDVDCNVAWEASAEEDWVQFKVKNGTGPGKLVVSLPAFTEGAGRDGIITVKAGELEDRISISQGYGTLIGDVIWAKYDVADPGTFTNDLERSGKMYQWNSKIAYAAGNEADTTAPEGYATGIATYPEDVTTWQEENNPCPKGWHVPTIVQAEALIGWGSEGTNKFTWNWGAVTQGAYIGNENAGLAHTVNGMLGNIFIPMSAKRNGGDGTITYTGSTFIQTAEKMETWDGGYGRIYYQVHWDNASYQSSGEGYCTMPVRCVAEFTKE